MTAATVSYLRPLVPGELTPDETRESLLLVCYERTLFHYLRRNQRLDTFAWLLADRYLGLHHVPCANEGIAYLPNGLRDLQTTMETTVTTTPDDLVPHLAERLAEGWQAHAMMTARRPDGATYVTSTLVEGMWGDHVYLTKTNEASGVTRRPVPVVDLLSMLVPDDAGHVGLTFIRADEAVLAPLRQPPGVGLFRAVMHDTYGYRAAPDGLSRPGHGVPAGGRGLAGLLASVEADPDQLLRLGEDKRLQLRLNKHVGNKVAPVLHCWDVVAADPACAQVLAAGGALLPLRAASAACRTHLADVEKWFTVLVGRPQDRFAHRYAGSLRHLTDAYAVWQGAVADGVRLLLQEGLT